jgi:hypothetical protein
MAAEQAWLWEVMLRKWRWVKRSWHGVASAIVRPRGLSALERGARYSIVVA